MSFSVSPPTVPRAARLSPSLLDRVSPNADRREERGDAHFMTHNPYALATPEQQSLASHGVDGILPPVYTSGISPTVRSTRKSAQFQTPPCSPIPIRGPPTVVRVGNASPASAQPGGKHQPSPLPLSFLSPTFVSVGVTVGVPRPHLTFVERSMTAPIEVPSNCGVSPPPPNTPTLARSFCASPYNDAVAEPWWSFSNLPLLPEETEPDQHRVAQRVKQIVKGHASEGYLHYIALVKKEDRELGNEFHPNTPRPDYTCRKRQFNSNYAQWRRALHQWDKVTDPAECQVRGLRTLGELGLEPSGTVITRTTAGGISASKLLARRAMTHTLTRRRQSNPNVNNGSF